MDAQCESCRWRVVIDHELIQGGPEKTFHRDDFIARPGTSSRSRAGKRGGPREWESTNERGHADEDEGMQGGGMDMTKLKEVQ